MMEGMAQADRIHELKMALTKAIERMKTIVFQDERERAHWEGEIARLKWVLNEDDSDDR